MNSRRPGDRDGRGRPGRRAIGASLAVHAGLVGAIWISGLGTREMPEMRVYQVDITSPPPQVEGEPNVVEQDEPPVDTPDPAEAETEDQPVPELEEPTTEPEPDPEPEPMEEAPPADSEEEEADPEPDVEEEPQQDPPEEEPTRGEEAEPDSPGGEDLNVRLEGEQFPFPGYLANTIRQIHRHFRWTGEARLSAEVYFVIQRDGSVTDIQLIRGSGVTAFDYAAMSAIEQAARRGALGPLPDDFQGDRLPVSFDFEPR